MKHLSCYGHLTDLGPNGLRREGKGKAIKKEEAERRGGKIEKEVEKEELYFYFYFYFFLIFFLFLNFILFLNFT